MKFLHLGDLHIGKSLGAFHLIDDQRFILNQILELAEEKEVDGILIAGDVYDKAIPSEEAVRLFDFFLRQLAEKKKKVFLISGNHDSDERLNFGSSLFEQSEIYISSKFDGQLYKKEFMDAYGKVNVFLLPFVKASQVKHFYKEEKIESYDDAIRVILKHADLKKGERNVLVAHQFVAGHGEDPILSGSESMAAASVGLVEKISFSSFDDFDYVALGHIHSAQKIGREEVRYSGSPLKYSLSEVHSSKSVPIVEMKEPGDIQVELVPLRPRRDLRHIRGKLETLLDASNVTAPEDYMYVTLTDETMITDVMGIIQQYYPNTVKVEYDNSHTREIAQIDITKVAANKSFEEIFAEFYERMYGIDISEEELQIIVKIAEEVGVTYETEEADC